MAIVRSIRDFLALERNVVIVSLTSGIMSLVSGFWSPFMVFYMEELGATEIEIGFMYSASFLAYIIISIPFGHLADSFGRKRIIVVGTTLLGLAIISYAYAPSWQLLLVMIALYGAAHAMYLGALQAIIADSVSSERRATAYASLSLIGGLLYVPGPIIGGYLYESIFKSYRHLFIISGAACMLMAFVRVVTLRETLSARTNLQVSLRGFRKRFSIDLKDTVLGERSRTAFLVSSCIGSFAYGIRGGGMMMAEAFIIKYARDVIGLSESAVGIWQSLGAGFWASFLIPLGKLADRYGKKRFLVLASLVMFPALLGFIFSRSLLHVIICAVAFAMAGAIYATTHSALIADLTPLEKRATTMATFTALGSLFNTPGPPIGGFLYRNILPQATLYTALVLNIPALLVLIFFVKEPRSR